MSPSELAHLFQENPTQSYRLILTSGDRVLVADPRKAIVSEMVLFMREPENIEAAYGKVRLVSILNIAMVEPVSPAQIPGRSRRRRK